MTKPNFLVIVADDMGFSDAGCYGGEISTPNLDALAAKGLRYTQHYSTGRCWPSRACILTGLYYQQVPKVDNNGAPPDWGRPAPHYLKPHGYRCYHSGKWHVNQFPAPVAHGGFDRSYHIRDYNRNFAVQDHRLDDQPLPPVSPGCGYYSSTAVADHAVAFLDEHRRRHADQPFFMYLAFIAPHFPLHAPAEDIAAYRGRYHEGWDVARENRLHRLKENGLLTCDLSPRQPNTRPAWNLSEEELLEHIGPGEAGRAVSWGRLTSRQQAFQAKKMEIHAAMVHRLDREAGRVIDRLKSTGQWENTVTLFVSDNGASAEQILRGDGHDKQAPPGSADTFLCLGPGWSTASNTPFRYHKCWVHEGGIASPLIVHWPDGIRDGGGLRRAPSHFVDVLPTVLDLAGIPPEPAWRNPDRPALSGISLAPTFPSDVEPEREPLYFQHIGHRGLRDGKWKLVAVHHGRWELYDMENDRSETRNLADVHPDKVRDMAAEWSRRRALYEQQIGQRRE